MPVKIVRIKKLLNYFFTGIRRFYAYVDNFRNGCWFRIYKFSNLNKLAIYFLNIVGDFKRSLVFGRIQVLNFKNICPVSVLFSYNIWLYYIILLFLYKYIVPYNMDHMVQLAATHVFRKITKESYFINERPESLGLNVYELFLNV